MDDLWLLPGPSDVNVDLSRLQGETVGDETHYVVGLDASPRSEWLDAWRHVQSSSAVLRRFRIDPEEAIVRFTCRTADGTGMVFGVQFLVSQLAEKDAKLAPAVKVAKTLNITNQGSNVLLRGNVSVEVLEEIKKNFPQ